MSVIYLKIDGVKGSVTRDRYKDYIKVFNLHYPIPGNNSGAMGTVHGLDPSRRRYAQFNIVHEADTSETDILKLSQPDKTVKEMEAVFLNSDQNDALVNRKLLFKNCVISDIVPVDMGENATGLQYRVSYTQFELTRQCYDKENKPLSQKVAKYDVEKGIWS